MCLLCANYEFNQSSHVRFNFREELQFAGENFRQQYNNIRLSRRFQFIFQCLQHFRGSLTACKTKFFHDQILAFIPSTVTSDVKKE